MNRESIRKQLVEILTGPEHMGINIDPKELRDSCSLLADLSLDSIQTLELVVKIETVFGFAIASRELRLDVLNRFGDLVNYVDRRLSGNVVEAS